MAQKWILIVEDDPDCASILADYLRTEGDFAIQGAKTAPEALQKALRQKYELIFVDIQLARGTGDQLILQIRSVKSGPNHDTPIVVVSGSLDEELIKALAPHISGAIVKPFRKATLSEKIRDLIRSKVDSQ